MKKVMVQPVSLEELGASKEKRAAELAAAGVWKPGEIAAYKIGFMEAIEMLEQMGFQRAFVSEGGK